MIFTVQQRCSGKNGGFYHREREKPSYLQLVPGLFGQHAFSCVFFFFFYSLAFSWRQPQDPTTILTLHAQITFLALSNNSNVKVYWLSLLMYHLMSFSSLLSLLSHRRSTQQTEGALGETQVCTLFFLFFFFL